MNLEQLAKRIKGKVTILFGPSMVGKTTLAVHLSKFYQKPLYFRIDKNVETSDLKKINPKLDVVNVLSYVDLLSHLRDTELMKDHDLVIIDSLTGLNEELESRFKPPRLYLELSRYQRQVIYRLARLKPMITPLVITHSRLEDFETRTVGPSINNKVLKHAELVLYLYIDKNGERKLKIWAERRVPEKIDVKIEE